MRDDEYITEGEALSDNLEGCASDDFVGARFKEQVRAAVMGAGVSGIASQGRSARGWRKAVYGATKGAAVGEHVCCAGCGKSFVKRTYQHTFCRNRGRQNCKDKYWNCATDARWFRTVSRLMQETAHD